MAAMEVEVMEGALQVALPRLAALLAAMETAKASLLVPASGLDLSLLAFHKLKVLRIREALLIQYTAAKREIGARIPCLEVSVKTKFGRFRIFISGGTLLHGLHRTAKVRNNALSTLHLHWCGAVWTRVDTRH
uniref:Uncharacterized protein n=1 Tax=Timema cristinae TaxID=61476 RepID=A0A7R9H9V5_TIMCR|nr:unnamed protein product [Timema cristinae]